MEPTDTLHIPISGEKVLHLRLVQSEKFARKIFKECEHHKVKIDPTLMHLQCEDCEKDVSPIMWLRMLIGEWGFVQDQYRRLEAAKMAYEAKRRCRCEHCGKVTTVKPPSSAQIRAFNEQSRGGE